MSLIHLQTMSDISLDCPLLSSPHVTHRRYGAHDMATIQHVHPQADVERWTELARQLGFSDFLSAQDGFRQCEGKRTWANARESGIYFWLATDGQAYVGKSMQPRARLRQHMKTHGDLLWAAFRPCAHDELDALEARLVDLAGEHFPLRNIKLAVSTASEVPFDRIVTPEEQSAFLAGGELPVGEWRHFEQLERLQQRKFENLCAHPFASEVIAATQLFVGRAIPKPAETEVSFWSATVQTSGLLLRLNVGQQEVFTLEQTSQGLSVRLFTAERLSWFHSWRSPYQTRSFVTRMKAEQLAGRLTGSTLLSCRKLVVQLMRHTQALNSGSHCPQLVRQQAGPDRLIEPYDRYSA